MWLKAATVWLVILVLAVLNGALREAVLVPMSSRATGFLLSGVILSACILVVAYIAAPWYGRLSSRRWFKVGLFWIICTLTFEFGVGRIIQHKTWHEMLGAYTFEEGNLWPVVVLVTFLAPWLAARFRRGL